MKPRVGDRVTSRVAERPYSSSAYNWDRSMFEPGAHAELIDYSPTVWDAPCRHCGKRHQTFARAQFKNAKGQWDQVAIALCNVVRA